MGKFTLQFWGVNVDKRMKKTFLVSLICGLWAYLYCLVNNFNNYDNICMVPGGPPLSYNAGIVSGRWFLSILGDAVDRWIPNYNIPFFNGIIAILILGVISCVLVQILEIKNETLCMLLAGITMAFPAVASGMFFTYTVQYYMLGVLLAVIAVWIAKCAVKKYIILSGLLLAYSLGLYQAYYPFAISLFVLLLIKMCIEDNYSSKEIIAEGLKYIFALVLGYVLYRIFLSLALRAYEISLYTYKGVSQMGNINISDIPGLVLKTYKSFLKLPFKEYMSINSARLVKLSILYIYAMTLVPIVHGFKKKKYDKLLLLVFLAFIFPIAVNFIIIMVPLSDVYTLMILGPLAIFYVPVIIVECVDLENIRFKKILKILTCTVLTVSIVNYIWFSNGNYRKMYFMEAQLENYYSSMITRAKSEVNYTQDKPIKLIGEIIEDESFINGWRNTPFNYGGITYDGNETNINEYSRLRRLKQYFGHEVYMVKINSREYKKYENEINTMTRYPDYGSVRAVDDAILIRLE